MLNFVNKLKVTTLAVSSMIVLSSSAFAQEACKPYAVKAGDSLGTIAEAAYGTSDFQMIFNANRNTLNNNPNDLKEGTVLSLPCLDGRISNDVEFNDIVNEQSKIASQREIADVYAPDVRLLASNDWAPYTEETMNGGGALMRLAVTALHRGGNNRKHVEGWIDDIDAHLHTLLPSGAYDIAVAWVVPNCAKNPDLMGGESLFRCNDFYASVPVYESVIGYYTLIGSKYANATRLEDYAGATFCRAEGYFTSDLEEAGLVEPVITLLRPKLPRNCFEAVLTGEADATGFAVQNSTGIITSLSAQDELAQNKNFTYLSSIHLLAHKSNPFALEYISMLNNGLNEMRKSGEWYDIVASSLAENNASNQ